MKHIVFVCAGNICRSPMAEALFRALARGRPVLQRIEVGSAGTMARPGNSATPQAIEVMRAEYGIDLHGHRARPVEGLTADLFLTVDHTVLRETLELGVSGRIELLGGFAGAHGECIDDPYGGSPEAYLECARCVERLVRAAMQRLEAELGE